MRSTLTIFLYMLCCLVIKAQDCNVINTLDEIATFYKKGDFTTALKRTKTLEDCSNLTLNQTIENYTWQFKLYRNQGRAKHADRAILSARSLLINQGMELDLDFRMLLLESGAFREDKMIYEATLKQTEKEIFNTVPEDHLSLGQFYYLISHRNSDAVPSLLKALHHFEQLDSPPPVEMGRTLRTLGNITSVSGDFEKAAQYYRQELNLYLMYYPEDQFDVSVCYYHFGNLGYERLEYKTALENYLKAYPIWASTYDPDHYRMKGLNEAIGDMYWELGDQANALVYFDRSTTNEVAINNDKSEETISNADSLLQKGNYATAIDYYNEAVAWREKTYGKQHSLTAACKNFVARAVHSSGDLHGALNAYQEAIHILVPELKNTSWVANPEPGMQVQSFQYLLEALISKGDILKELYKTSKDLTHLEAALNTQETAISVLERIKNTQISETSKVFWVSRTRSLIESSIETAITLAALREDNRYLEQAFNFAERSKALLLLTSLYDQEITSFSRVPEDIVQREKELKNKLNDFNGKINREEKRCGQARRTLIQLYRNELQSTQNDYDLYLNDLKDQYPEYYQLKYNPDVVSVASLQNELLDSDTRMISYFTGIDKLFVFLLTSTSLTARSVENASIVLQETNELIELIKDQRTYHDTPQTTYEDLNNSLHDLYKVLLAPEITEGEQNRLIVIPDGNLSYLPFGLLLKDPATTERDYKSLSYIMKDYAISYSPSASVLWISSKTKYTNDTYMGFAPSYQGQVFRLSS